MEKLTISNADEKKALLKRIRKAMDQASQRRGWAADLYEDMDQSFIWGGRYDAFYDVYSWIDKATSFQKESDDDAWHKLQNIHKSVKAVRPFARFRRIVRITDSPCSACSFDGDDEEYFEQIEYDDDTGNPTIWRCLHCGQVMHNLGETK